MERRIKIPEGVDIEIVDKKIIIKGPKGILEKDFSDPRFDIKIEKNSDIVISGNNKRKTEAVIGTISSLIKNMIIGVTKGFLYKMKIVYTHFPISVEIKGDKVLIKNFFGEKGARVANIVGDTKMEIKKDDIFLIGVNKEDIGQTAANIEKACKLSKRDRRIFSDGIFIVGWEVCE